MHPIHIAVMTAAAALYLMVCNLIYKKRLEHYKQESCRQRYLASHDSLTGLYNRKSMERRIQRILSSIPGIPDDGSNPLYYAMLILDLDHFKQVNDNHGHPAGDSLLKQVARMLKSCVRSVDLVGRLGGDEFLIFLNRPDSKEEVLGKAQHICQSIHSLTASRREWGTVTASIGIALTPQDGVLFHQLYRKADQSLYCAKHNGKDGYFC